MTSRVLFFRLVKENSKQRIWTVALAMLVFFLVMPVTMLVAYGQMGVYAGTELDLMMRKYAFFEEMFTGVSMQLVLGVIVTVGALICGVSGFSYLFSKKKVDLYHSIPVKREVLFSSVYVNGILIYLIPYVLNLLVCLLFMISQIGMKGELITGAFLAMFQNLLYFLFVYHTAILAVMLTGNMINCFVMGGFLGLYSILMYVFIMGYQSYFFDTFYGNGNEYARIFYLLSPLTVAIRARGGFGTNWKGYHPGIENLQIMILMLVLLAACVWLYRRRPSEAAERSIAFPKIIPFVRTALVVFGALCCGLFFYSVSYQKDAGWLFFGIIFGVMLSHVLLEILYHMSIRGAWKHKRAMAGVGVFSVLVACSFLQDWWGYDTYLPDKDSLQSMGIYYYMQEEFFYSVEGERSIYYGSDRVLENMELTQLDAPYELARYGVEYARANNGQEVVLTQDGEYERWISVTLRYTKKNGKDIYRSYMVNAGKLYEGMVQIYASQEYKETMYKMLLEEDSNRVESALVTTFHSGTEESLSPSLSKKLLESYRKEKMNMTYEEFSSELPCARVTFFMRTEERYYTQYGYLYPSFSESLALLKEAGLSKEHLQNTFDADKIQSVMIVDYAREQDSYAMEYSPAVYEKYGYDEKYGINIAGYLGEEFTQREEIEALAKVLKSNEYYHGTGYQNHQNLADWEIWVSYAEDFGDITYYAMIRKEDVPDFVWERMQVESE